MPNPCLAFTVSTWAIRLPLWFIPILAKNCWHSSMRCSQIASSDFLRFSPSSICTVRFWFSFTRTERCFNLYKSYYHRIPLINFASPYWCASLPCQEGWHRPALSLFAKVFIAFSCTLPKVTYSQNFLLTRLDFCGSLFQQLNITYFYIFVQTLRGWTSWLSAVT